MLLPAGTIRALRKNTDAVAFVVMACLSLGALSAGAPPVWTSVVAVLAFAFYNQRRASAEAHDRALAEKNVLLAVAKVDAVKAKRAELTSPDQASLPLTQDRSRTPRGESLT